MIFHLVNQYLHIKIFRNSQVETYLKIKNIKLWARVGVLEEERELGQLFNLDVFLWANFENCTQNDNIDSTVDYSKLVQILI